MYAGLLSFNASLLLRIATKLLSNILCGILLGFDAHFKYISLTKNEYGSEVHFL